MMKHIRLSFGVAATLGFLLSLVVHVAGLLGHDVGQQFPLVWLLHMGIFAVFIPFILFARQELGGQPNLLQLGASVPRWIAMLGAIIMAYAVVNFFLFIGGTGGGSPSIENGKYLLTDHGKLIRELSAAEYHAFKANELRGFSGHWLVFYFVSAAYLLLGKTAAPSFESKRSH